MATSSRTQSSGSGDKELPQTDAAKEPLKIRKLASWESDPETWDTEWWHGWRFPRTEWMRWFMEGREITWASGKTIDKNDKTVLFHWEVEERAKAEYEAV